MILRPAEPADIPALAAIASDSYRTAFADILEKDVIESRDAAYFASRFVDTWPRMWVACADGKPAGFLLMTDGHIDMLFMSPGAIGHGGGAQLLEQAETLGARSLECFRDNHAARRFYERHGWRVAREYRRDFAGREGSFVFYTKTVDQSSLPSIQVF